MTIAAAERAMSDSGVHINYENADRVGVYIGSSCIGVEVIEQQHRKLLEQGRVSPYLITSTMVNLAAGVAVIPSE